MVYLTLFILGCVFLSYISRNQRSPANFKRDSKGDNEEEDNSLLGNFMDFENRKDK